MRSVKQIFDFHCHSTASDGTLTPQEMIELAVESELQVWSLTDHDTLSGYPELLASLSSVQQANGAAPLKVIPGVELSCDWNSITIHVLALGFNSSAQPMLTFLEKQQYRRQQRAIKIGERIQEKLKIGNAYAEACRISGNSYPGRPHFANLLLEHKVVGTFAEAFTKYLGAGKWGDVKLFWPQLDELMEAVKQSAGIGVVAHPFQYKMTASKLRRLIDDFDCVGGAGVELSVPNISNGHFGWLVDELARRKMIQSGGSDFHGVLTPWSRLGYFPARSERIPSVVELLA